MSDNFFKNHGSSPGRVCIPPRPNSPVSHKSVTPAPFFGESVTSHRPAEPVRCLIGIQFCWSNGERLDDYAWKLTLGDGSLICDQLGTKSYISQFIPSASHSVQLVPGFDAQQVLSERRAELQKALQDILAAERAEAQRLKAIQDQRGPATQVFYDLLAVGKGFFYGAWGLVKTLDEFEDLINPFNHLAHAVTAAWNTQVQRGQSWLDAFNELYKAELHRELVEALGFDPTAISREDLAKAYETTCYILDDEQSVRLLKGFALEYLQIQNRETLLEVAGAVLFEIVFAALLILITGGTGLAVRGAALAARLSPLLQALGQSLHKLGLSLKIARVHKDGRAAGTDSKPQTVVLERPKAAEKAALVTVVAKKYARLTLSMRHFPNKVTTPKATGNTMYTIPKETVLIDLKEIQQRGEEIREGQRFYTSSGRVYGWHDEVVYPVSGPGTVSITSQEYQILMAAKKSGEEAANKFADGLVGAGRLSEEQVERVFELVDFMRRRP